jgi:(R,R)-butanediol dehydrogenase/meso-butanediol dehydrogenase/diacetyl reductase
MDTDEPTKILGERTMAGILVYLGGPRSGEEYGTVIDMLAEGQFDPQPLITDHVGLDDIVDDGFERLLNADIDQVKIMVEP